MIRDFIAIDFETANQQPSSVCSVTACLAPCDGGAEQLTTTMIRMIRIWRPRTFSRCDVVVKVVMVILVKIDFREMNIDMTRTRYLSLTSSILL